jgi:purine-binding chemotaxis protein CheW
MSDKSKHPSLIEQKEALSVYFDALLREPEGEPAPATYDEKPELPAPPVIAPPVVVPVSVPQAPTETEVAQQAALATAAAEEGRPAWAEHEFQALLFRAGGLTLAVPLVELNGIQEWQPEQVTPMPGHVSWYLGLMTYRGRSVPVIDTAQLVLPQERLQRLDPDPQTRLQRIVFIGEGRWGLACDAVSEVISLSEEQVRWRTSRTKRRWLAGTVIEHMCALLDPPAFAEMLASGIEDVPGDPLAGDEE